MNFSDLANLGQIIGAIGVMITLVYLAIQIRGNTRVVSAQARHALSEFVLHISIFRAEYADRFAKLESGAELTDGDRQFQYWSHVQFLLHAETYFLVVLVPREKAAGNIHPEDAKELQKVRNELTSHF